MAFLKMVWRETKIRQMNTKRRQKKLKNMRTLTVDTQRKETKDNFSVTESINGQTSKGSLILPDLPNDLLDLIIRNLDLVDRFHLGLVCKSFSVLVRNATRASVKTKFGVPCLLVFARDCKTCSLINPLHKEKYKINTPSLPTNSEIVCAKDGWLLLLCGDNRSIFFYNPLNKLTIRLPDLTFPINRSFSFSCPPTSPNCIVIASVCIRKNWTTFHICRRGSEQWSGYIDYVEGFSFAMYYTKPVFYQEILYCLGDDGRLATFDPVKLLFRVQKKPKSDWPNTYLHYLVESEGQLLRVWADSENKLVHIRKLDHRWKQWKEVDSLGDNALYVSRNASLSSKTLSTSSIGRVYFPMLRGEEVVSFSCEIGKLPNFYGAGCNPYGCWIEPNCTQSSPEELEWSKT